MMLFFQISSGLPGIMAALAKEQENGRIIPQLGAAVQSTLQRHQQEIFAVRQEVLSARDAAEYASAQREAARAEMQAVRREKRELKRARTQIEHKIDVQRAAIGRLNAAAERRIDEQRDATPRKRLHDEESCNARPQKRSNTNIDHDSTLAATSIISAASSPSTHIASTAACPAVTAIGAEKKRKMLNTRWCNRLSRTHEGYFPLYGNDTIKDHGSELREHLRQLGPSHEPVQQLRECNWKLTKIEIPPMVVDWE